jgi:two-component system phosphate regulon sensor histidine kinase PhoR
MFRSFFSRIFLQSALVLLALMAVGGFLLDRFLVRSEIDRLGDQVSRLALMLREDLARAPDTGDLQERVRRMGEITNTRFTVVDPTGRVLADSRTNPATMENHATHPEVAAALAGTQGRSLRHSATLGIDMLYIAEPGVPVVRAAVSVAEVRSVLLEIRMRIALAALPAAAAALILAYLLAGSLNRRIERMIRFASAIERGEEGPALRPGGDDELADMERSLVALREEILRQVDALRRDKETLTALLEGFPHAVLVFGPRRDLSLANGPARRLLRLPDGGFQGHTVREVVRHPKILEALEGAFRGESAQEPFRLEWGDPPGWVEVTAHPLPGEGGASQALLVLRDVSREAHLERVRSDFMVNLSHEMRTPLTAVRGAAETLRDAPPADPETLRRFLETIRRNSLRLETLLADVSDLARAEFAAEPLNVERLDAREPLRHVCDLFATEAQRAQVSLSARLPAELLPLDTDAGKIEQILINLVQNAIRYTPAGGSVSASVSLGEGAVVYEVEDTGIGIPERDIPRVTERFYRVDPGRSRAMGGTGLGLAIVKHLTENLGGRLEIRSVYGEGTTVRIIIPA